MIHHIWSIVCLRSIIDNDTNTLSLIDVVEELTIQGEPDPKKRVGSVLEVVSLWSKEDINTPEKGKCKVSFLSPDQEVLKSQSLDILLETPQFDRMRTRMRFFGLPLSKAGIYSFKVEYAPFESEKFQHITSIPCNVKFIPEESKGPDSED